MGAHQGWEADVRGIDRARAQAARLALACSHVDGDVDGVHPGAEFETWHVYDAGGPMLRLTVRYREEVEEPNWRNGPDVFEALQQAATQGWEAYDREPGDAPGEVMIFHIKRWRPTSPPCR